MYIGTYDGEILKLYTGDFGETRFKSVAKSFSHINSLAIDNDHGVLAAATTKYFDSKKEDGTLCFFDLETEAMLEYKVPSDIGQICDNYYLRSIGDGKFLCPLSKGISIVDIRKKRI